MQVGMAMLCGQIKLREAVDGGERECGMVVSVLNWCMQTSSIVHGRIGSLLNGTQAHWQRDTGLCTMAGSRMISVNELVTLLGINMDALNIGVREFLVCKEGLSTHMIPSPGKMVGDSKESEREGSALQYEPDAMFISLSHLPMCMVMSPAHRDAGHSTVALVTANSHTVCVACYYHSDRCCNHYALFDPMPGMLWAGMSAAQMVMGVRNQLMVPQSVCGSIDSVQVASSQKRKKEAAGAAGAHQWVDCCQDDDGSMIQCLLPVAGKSKDSKARTPLDGGMDASQFYCDVTLLHMK
jgi:hypothetical protein